MKWEMGGVEMTGQKQHRREMGMGRRRWGGGERQGEQASAEAWVGTKAGDVAVTFPLATSYFVPE